MNEDVLGLVRATRSTDSISRQRAEADVSSAALSSSLDFFTALFDLAKSPQTPIDDAQSAILVIKLVVVRHWSIAFEQYTGPPLSMDARNYLRGQLLELLAKTPRKLVRNAAALVVARIGGYEYPDQWPDLVKTNIQMMCDSSTLAGGLVLFRELLADTLREQDFFEVGPYVLPRLLEVASADNGSLTLDAIQCFHQCITYFLMGDDDELPALERVAGEHIPAWINLFCHLLVSRTEDEDLLNEIIETIRDIDNAFHTVLEPLWPSVFWTVVTSLEKIGTSSEYADIATAESSLLDHCLRSVPPNNVFKLEGATHLERLERVVSLCLRFAEINEELQEQWLADFNDFVSFELELSGDIWPRQSVSALVGTTGQRNLFGLLVNAAQHAKSWTQLEAALFLLSNVLLQVDIDKTDATSESIMTVLHLTEQARQSQEANPLLQVRCILCAVTVAKYAVSLDREVRLALFLSMLNDNFGDELVRTARIKAVSMGSGMFPQDFKPYQRQFLELISSLIEDAQEDTPGFLVEAFLAALRLDFAAAVQYDGVFQMFFSLASKDTSDVELNIQIIELVHELLDHTAGDSQVSARLVYKLLVPVLEIASQARANKFDYSSDLNFALDMASAVLERESISLDEQARNQLLDVFYDIVTTTEDSQILQAGSFAYSALVANMPADFKVNPETAQQILGVAARLLDPNLNDSAALASGKLVTAIVDRQSESTVDVLTAAAQRLAQAENALLIESLTLVFCELVLRNAQAVVDLLAATAGLLEETMRKWMATFEVIRGADEINKNIQAFQLLFDLHDARLDNVEVDDKPVIDPNKILTRSRARNLKFTQVPLPLKIIKLLIKELSQQPAMYDPLIEEGDEESEWEEEVAIGLDGDLVDHRNFRLIVNWFKKLGQQGMRWFPQLSSEERRILMDATKK